MTSLALTPGTPLPQTIEEVSAQAILADYVADIIARHPAASPVITLESELARKVAEAGTYRETLLRERVNEAYRANILAFAEGLDLDYLADFYGVERLSGEDDARLRKRTVLAQQGRSTAGPLERYLYVALSASVDVEDAHIWVGEFSPVINVAVVSTAEGGIASPELLATVRSALEADDVRVVSDRFNVIAAVNQSVSVTAKIWLLPSAPANLPELAAIALRTAWHNEGGLGFDLTRAWLTGRLMQPGVQRVEIVAPAADIPVAPHTAVALGQITLSYQGRAM